MCLIPKRTNCKACMSAHRTYIDTQLQEGVSHAAIVRELARRGEQFSAQNISTHAMRHVEERVDALLQSTIDEYEERARYAPVEELPLLHIVIQGLRQLKDTKTPPDTIIRAMDAITRQREAKTQQALLMAWAERAFPTPAKPPLAATAVRQLEAS